jgi:hypothetical protein
VPIPTADENSPGRVGLRQFPQPSGELGDADAAMVELANIPGRELSRFVHLDGQNDWNTGFSLDYLGDDNQHLNYLQL